jgi:protein TonB
MLGLLAVSAVFGQEGTSPTQAVAPGSGTNGIGSPTCIYCPNPAYPDAARKAKYQGIVTLQAVVGVDGRASDIKVLEGSRRYGVQKSAVETLREWRFKPALDANGKAVATLNNIHVHFVLNGFRASP